MVLSQALNPFSLIKMDAKVRMKSLEGKLVFLENRVSLQEANYRILMARAGLLEEGNGKLLADIQTVQAIFTPTTSVRNRIEILTQFSPL